MEITAGETEADIVQVCMLHSEPTCDYLLANQSICEGLDQNRMFCFNRIEKLGVNRQQGGWVGG